MFNKNKFAQIIKSIKSTYTSQEEFSKVSGIGRTYLSQYMNMKLDKPPKPEILEKLAKASKGNITYKELMLICNYIDDELDIISGETINVFNNPYIDINQCTPAEYYIYSIIYTYDNLETSNFNNIDKKKITESYNYIKNDKEYSKYITINNELKNKYNTNIDKNIQGMGQKTELGAVVFVYGTIPAGKPIECIEDIIDTEEIPADMLKGGKEYFGLRVKGNSMEPEYLDGDTLILLKQEDCENGDDCVVMVNGQEGTFKRVFKNENGIILQPLNNAYPPTSYSNKEIEELPVKILGIVEEIRRKKRRK